jgi:C-terminal processing protease CtpA/Prc
MRATSGGPNIRRRCLWPAARLRPGRPASRSGYDTGRGRWLRICRSRLLAGPVAWQVDGHGESYAYTPPGDRPIVSWPVVVLIDRGTASAAEVVAAALHDAAGAPLIGERTFGKGSVQYLRDLGDGSGVTITAARLVSPAGIRFDGVGLSPDIAVGASSPDGTDPALELAVQLLSLRLPVHAGPASPGHPTTEGR